MDDLLSEHKQAVVVMPPKAAETTMATFHAICMSKTRKDRLYFLEYQIATNLLAKSAYPDTIVSAHIEDP